MFRNVLVPVDRSSFAETAIPQAAAIARRCGGKLHLVMVHAITVPDAIRGAPLPFDASLDLGIRRNEQKYLEALASRVATDHAILPETVLLDGAIASAIDAHCHAIDADLVVISTHGRTGVQRAWLGSVADRLIRRLSIPVLLIRPRADVAEPFEPTIKHILVGLDGSRLAEGALAAASAIAGTETRCTALRVAVPPRNPGSPYIPDAARANRDALETSVRAARAYLDALSHRVRSNWASLDVAVLTSWRPAEAILEAAKGLDADLIAVATQGHGPIVRAVIGSVADEVIRGSTVPVLVVPAHCVEAKLTMGHEDSLEIGVLTP
jgi:nucleotide-binding universal stress UspA family protein